MATSLLPYDEWVAGTLQNSVPANTNALRSEVLAANVISDATTAQPGSPADGDCYIIPSGRTGAQWSTFAIDSLAYYRGGTWYEFTAYEGLLKVVAGELQIYNGSAWGVYAGSGGSGDVVGPASATADAVALFDGTTGKLLKNGVTIAQIQRIEQNSQSAAYTLVLADAGRHIFHPSADTTARTWTIPANASVAFPIGTAVTFVNQNAAGVITIAITSDTMRLAGAGTTGSRTLAANGIATALKVTATEWLISGTGLT